VRSLAIHDFPLAVHHHSKRCWALACVSIGSEGAVVVLEGVVKSPILLWSKLNNTLVYC
jgi:hypothetical protein